MLKRNIPNYITLGNLICGCLGIQQLLAGNPLLAPFFVLAAAFLDFFDGMAARALKVSSPIGKDLDSLADVVSFGVLPGFMAYWLMARPAISCVSDKEVMISAGLMFPAAFALLVPAFSAFRLAKFNHDTRQTESFIGLPTPANALFWSGMMWLQADGYLAGISHKIWIYLFLVALTCYLLIAEIPMFSFKMKNLAWKGNELRYTFIGLCIPLFIFLKLAALAPVILLFVVVSILDNKMFGIGGAVIRP
jgi:CDP-diacylglycerol--serine O-phosphatidyltransferase